MYDRDGRRIERVREESGQDVLHTCMKLSNNAFTYFLKVIVRFFLETD